MCSQDTLEQISDFEISIKIKGSSIILKLLKSHHLFIGFGCSLPAGCLPRPGLSSLQDHLFTMLISLSSIFFLPS
jgi:hypothetical protein